MIYFFQLILNFLCSFLKKDNKAISFFGICTLAFYAGTMTKYDSYDTLTYEKYFNALKFKDQILPDKFEYGYEQLNKFIGNIGFNYSDFRLITTIAFFILLFWVLIRFRLQTNVFVTLFSIFPFFSEATQVRNLMMVILVLLAITMLSKKTMRSYIIGFLLIILASQFHSFGYFYLLIFPLMLFKDDFIFKIIKILPVFSILITIILINRTDFAIDIIKTLISNQDKVAAYSLFYINYYVLIAIFSINIICTFLVLYSAKKFMNNNIKLLIRIFLLTSAIVPIICVSSAGFTRVLRTEIIVTFIIISICLNKYRNSNIKLQSVKVIMPICIIMLLALFYLDSGTISFKQQEFGSTMASFIPYILHIKSLYVGVYDGF